MDNEQILIQRERRFEVADLTGFDAIVSREDADDSQYFAELLDFSRTGVKFSLPFFAKFDEILCVQFKLKNSDLQYTGNGRVRHIRNIEQNRWQVGCSLDPPLPDEVVGFLAKTTNQERRRFERIEVVGHQGNLLRQGKGDGCESKLINVSKGGFCLWVPTEHRTGERVDFVIANPAGQDETIVARIRWQTESEGGFRLGCSFADSSSYEKLVDCIVKKQEAANGDSINWYVAAAAILVMFIPPATYFMMGFGGRASSNTTASVAVENSGPAVAAELASPVPADDKLVLMDDQQTTARERLVDTIEVDNESSFCNPVSEFLQDSIADQDSGGETITSAGPNNMMHSPLDDFLPGVGMSPSETEGMKTPNLEVELAADPQTEGKSRGTEKPENKGVATNRATVAGGHGPIQNTVAGVESRVTLNRPNQEPSDQLKVAQTEPVPPAELTGSGVVRIKTAISGEASTRRVTAIRTLDVPSEKISK